MARIRSIHPGLFTDEAYMALSFPARELIKGLWCEADDQGVFEWKPLTLKARIMPADAVDVGDLLGELVGNRFIVEYEAVGKQYGAIRNFRRYQRPKKPSHLYPLPNEYRTYVGLTDDSAEPVGNQFGTGGGKSPQMEDGGGRKKEKESTSTDSTVAAREPEAPKPAQLQDLKPTKGDPAVWAIVDAFDASQSEIFGPEQQREFRQTSDYVWAERWLKAGADADTCRRVFDTVNAKLKAGGYRPRRMLKALDDDIVRALAERGQAEAAPMRANGNGRHHDTGGSPGKSVREMAPSLRAQFRAIELRDTPSANRIMAMIQAHDPTADDEGRKYLAEHGEPRAA